MQLVNTSMEEAKVKITFVAMVNHRKEHYIKMDRKDIKNIKSLEEKGRGY